MFLFITIIYSFLLQFSLNYTQLKKHSSVKVMPNEKVYFDLSSFEVGDLITIEITMDLFWGGDRNKYTYQIDQVPATSYYDSYWNTLRKVTNRNVSCDDDDCTFTWEEIKREGSTYIYIIPLAPYSNFINHNEKIKIKHPGGDLSAGAIVGIVLGCVAFVVLVSVCIPVCCCKYNPRCYNCCPCCRCCCCKIYTYGDTYGRSVVVQPPVYPVVEPAPVYPPPVYPSPVVPYSGSNFI